MKLLFLIVNLSGAVVSVNASCTPAPNQQQYIAQRAAFNYAINCRGCHGPEAMNTHASVPDMNGFIDRFLAVEGGRQYLIQVPGVSRSALSNKEVAQILNWLVTNVGASKELKQRFTEQEVARFRVSPLGANAADVRAKLVRKIEQQ